MSLKAKIEAVIYASEEPVTLQQLVALLGHEAGEELDRLAAEQGTLALESVDDAGEQAGGEIPLREGDEGGQPEAEPPADETSHDAQSQAEVGTSPAADPADAEASTPAVSTDTVEADAANQPDVDTRKVRERERAVREHIRRAIDGLIRDYATGDRGLEIREVASGYRMATKPEYHDAVRGFVKSLKPALKLTLPALETLAVVAYKQPVTAAEISEVRGVDSAGVLGGLLARKLIGTAGRKQVLGRPMLYKTTRDFLLRFGLKDVTELPSMDEFERMAGELDEQEDLPTEQTAALIEQANVRGDAEHIRALTASGTDAEATDLVESAQEHDGTLTAKAAAVSSNTTEPENATAANAAGGHDDRHNEPAAAAPLYPTEAGEPAGEQTSEPGSQTTAG